MTGTPRFLRVVAHLGTVLMAVQHFDGGVAIENPRRVQRLLDAFRQRAVHPCRTPRQRRRPSDPFLLTTALRLIRYQMRQGPAQTFVADDLVHAEDLWRHFIAAQPGHLRIAPLPIQNRQQPGAQHIDHRRRIRAGVGHRATLGPALEHARDVQKLGKERQLPQCRRTAAFIPAHLKPTTWRRQAVLCQLSRLLDQRPIHRLDQRFLLKLNITHRVTLPFRRPPAPALSLTDSDRG